MGKNKKKGASRIEKATAKREKKIAQRIKKDIGKIGEVYLLNNSIIQIGTDLVQENQFNNQF